MKNLAVCSADVRKVAPGEFPGIVITNRSRAMAHRVSYKVIGIDVSKRTLEVFEYGTEQSFSIANDSASIEQWLAQWEVVVQFALEPTNRYHLLFAERVHERGHQVYLVDGYRLMHYRESVGQQVKSDSCDAQLLARYATHEQGQLRLWQPQSTCGQRFLCFLKRRATLVRTRVQLKQSLRELVDLQTDVDRLLSQCTAVIRKLEQAMREEASQAGRQGRAHYSLPGITWRGAAQCDGVGRYLSSRSLSQR